MVTPALYLRTMAVLDRAKARDRGRNPMYLYTADGTPPAVDRAKEQSTMNNNTRLSASLSEAQEEHARHSPVRFRIYTENYTNLLVLTYRYFPNATVLQGEGMYQGAVEKSNIIEVIGTLHDDLQKVADLAGDIKLTNKQDSVLVTWERVNRLDI